jgi:hypothetical protein
MSLTSFVAEKAVKEKFAQEFPKPKIKLEGALLAPPVTNHWSLVGIAFDYLLRFYIKWLNPFAIEREWIAEHVQKGFLEHERMILLGPTQEEYLKTRQLYKIASRNVDEARAACQRYLKDGEITDELIRCAVRLARIDPIFRAWYVDPDMGVADDGDVEDLRRLISLVKPEFFKAQRLCLLNPTFGLASRLVGGADADLVIDDAIVDIKTTKSLKLQRKYFHQLVGYYLLFRLGGLNDAPTQPNVEKLGVYFSRHGKMVTCPIEEVVDESRLPAFYGWLREYICDPSRTKGASRQYQKEKQALCEELFERIVN